MSVPVVHVVGRRISFAQLMHVMTDIAWTVLV